jgi:hypothetical protein
MKHRAVLEKLIVRSAGEETTRLLWKPNVRHRVHKYLLPLPVLSRMNLIRTPETDYSK